MSVATVKFDRTKIVRAMREVASIALNEGAKVMQTKIRDDGLNRVSAWQSKPGGWPGKRSGKLGLSIKLSPATKTKLLARVGSNLIQAGAMQYGAVAKGRGLTVPVHEKASNGLDNHNGIRGLAKAQKLVYIKYNKGDTVGAWVKLTGRTKKKKMEFWVVHKKKIAARPWATLGVKEFRAASVKAAQDAFARDWAVIKQRIMVKYGGAKP